MNYTAEQIKKLADDYAHVYAFVGDDSLPKARKELHHAIDSLLRERESAPTVPDDLGKRQWDELAEILGADGDNVDKVFNVARRLVSELEESKMPAQATVSVDAIDALIRAARAVAESLTTEPEEGTALSQLDAALVLIDADLAKGAEHE